MLRDNHPEAEICFHRALTIARQQEARWWELRAATSLGRLWRPQGRRAHAHELLGPVYAWFTEGFDRPTSGTPGTCSPGALLSTRERGPEEINDGQVCGSFPYGAGAEGGRRCEGTRC